MTLPRYNKKTLRIVAVLLIIFAALFVYTRYNPEDCRWFPKCIFYSITGLKCPGCGSQRAIHSLLNGNIVAAVRYNILVVIAIPYVLLGLVLFAVPHLSPFFVKVKNTLYHGRAVYVVLALVMVFWILRNCCQYAA